MALTYASTDSALVLADGTVFRGRSFGADLLSADEWVARLGAEPDPDLLTHVGELVFNTAMSGYPEVLTDPSYTGQVVAMTYPHIGNYGIDPGWSERGPGHSGTREVMVAGLVCRALYRGPVRTGRQRLDSYLRDHGVPAIEGIDTRALTLHLRTHGSQNCLLCAAPDAGGSFDEVAARLAAFPSMEGRGLIAHVGSGSAVELPATPGSDSKTGVHIALYDCGAKANIVRELQELGCRITLLPAGATAEDIARTGAVAVMLSNGPGDPAVLEHQVDQTRALIGTMPVLGICLGHQIIAEALGAQTRKMSFGHHGVNHPVRDERTGRVFVTSQNHGFEVAEDSLPVGVDVWFRNANDGSIEGIRHDAQMVRTTQFHPESAPGPTDSRWIFDAFLEIVPGYRSTSNSRTGAEE